MSAGRRRKAVVAASMFVMLAQAAEAPASATEPATEAPPPAAEAEAKPQPPLSPPPGISIIPSPPPGGYGQQVPGCSVRSLKPLELLV